MSNIELMKKYGVAWFGFDESSGVIIDKLGNGYIGTLTNTPPRVAGWNGKGYALSFNGSNQYITMNNTTLPTQEKTIKFKLKTSVNPPYSSWILSNIASNTIGACVRLTGDGTIYTSTFNSASSYILLISKGNVVDGKWHDIIISYGKYISIYIDGELDSKIINNFNANIPTGAMRIGASASATPTGFLNGQIDDLQIYNKALTPSDFGLKRLIFQTEEKQVLSISKNPNRIKSFSSVNEDILLKYCYEINEIDNAVDAEQYIDLYKTTKEYEVINTGSTSLGNGKLFTVPLNTQYKTAVIDNNN